MLVVPQHSKLSLTVKYPGQSSTPLFSYQTMYYLIGEEFRQGNFYEDDRLTIQRYCAHIRCFDMAISAKVTGDTFDHSFDDTSTHRCHL